MHLLKRSKTCTSSGWWIPCWKLIDGNILSLRSSFTRIAVHYKIIRHVTTGKYFTAGALGLPWQTQCNEAMPWKGKHDLISHVYLHNVMIYMVMKLCLVGVLFGFLFQAVASPWKGTSSVMTLALDASVFVKVCNLWWVSDTVPQGRGFVPEQLLSRITPAIRTECRIYNFNQ